MKLDPDAVKLTTLTKQFEYEKIAREIDECEDISLIRAAAKCFLKLQMKQQESASQLFKDIL